MNFKFKISKLESQHGLAGVESNRAGFEEREMFKKFFQMTKKPTKPTICVKKRSHGTVFNMNEVFGPFI